MLTETSISSPCNRVCVVHPASRLCIGCGRSLDEIGRWIALNEAERSQIMAQLPARLAAINGVTAASAPA
ncbi:MAG TPA: DUF1289 domain-containing protein [Xanthobacteraceae bacterium]|jgi:predicted Fe-S protein YdhL (DUF1289 family)|nr:DUF1289 domain-containing protein [Xanthobacteraceae bacterium]